LQQQQQLQHSVTSSDQQVLYSTVYRATTPAVVVGTSARLGAKFQAGYVAVALLLDLSTGEHSFIHSSFITHDSST